MASNVERLQSWYLSQCDEDWEHTYGIRIESLDNPGWYVVIDLVDTPLDGRLFEPVRQGIADHFDIDDDHENPDWIDCRVEEGQFRAAGGPMKLDELIGVFLTWAMGAQAQ